MTHRRAFRPSVMSLEQFCAEPVSPLEPPRLPLTTVIAAAIRSDRIANGRPSINRVVAKLDRVQSMGVLLDPTFSTQWKRAAVARLGELGGGA
jgi:hypothetical protein